MSDSIITPLEKTSSVVPQVSDKPVLQDEIAPVEMPVAPIQQPSVAQENISGEAPELMDKPVPEVVLTTPTLNNVDNISDMADSEQKPALAPVAVSQVKASFSSEFTGPQYDSTVPEEIDSIADSHGQAIIPVSVTTLEHAVDASSITPLETSKQDVSQREKVEVTLDKVSPSQPLANVETGITAIDANTMQKLEEFEIESVAPQEIVVTEDQPDTVHLEAATAPSVASAKLDTTAELSEIPYDSTVPEEIDSIADSHGQAIIPVSVTTLEQTVNASSVTPLETSKQDVSQREKVEVTLDKVSPSQPLANVETGITAIDANTTQKLEEFEIESVHHKK
ncbi:hypothetical protein EB796_011533 [Bugula neritina]|uniref:Uncharacterized protein n=1 Tax=Bugula neritina TaxID=10212 RepID=A0A7J7JWD1_BUGNE|nr:hypothetical protein EB796_011533 [Bugula neritina]